MVMLPTSYPTAVSANFCAMSSCWLTSLHLWNSTEISRKKILEREGMLEKILIIMKVMSWREEDRGKKWRRQKGRKRSSGSAKEECKGKRRKMERERRGKEGGWGREGGNKSKRKRTRKKGEGKEDKRKRGTKKFFPRLGREIRWEGRASGRSMGLEVGEVHRASSESQGSQDADHCSFNCTTIFHVSRYGLPWESSGRSQFVTELNGTQIEEALNLFCPLGLCEFQWVAPFFCLFVYLSFNLQGWAIWGVFVVVVFKLFLARKLIRHVNFYEETYPTDE